jgi:diguanylate cyclase (GGDEF)-like protein
LNWIANAAIKGSPVESKALAFMTVEELKACVDQEASSPQARIDALNALAYRLERSDDPGCVDLYQQARFLAHSGPFAERPYGPGTVASLAGLSSWLMAHGQVDAAAPLCFEGIAAAEEEPPSSSLAQLQVNRAWLHFTLGESSAAMDWAVKALRLAREIGAPRQEASAQDMIGAIYGATNEPQQSLNAHLEAMRIVPATGDAIDEANFLNNYAMDLIYTGDFQAALEAGLKSLELSTRKSLFNSALHVTDTIAQVYLALSNPDQAETYLVKGLELAKNQQPSLDHMYLHRNLAQVYLARGDLDQAEDQLQRAAGTAEQFGVPNEAAGCYQLLSQVAAQRGDYRKALDLYQHFHILREKISTEDATKHLALVRATIELENTQRDAELQRLRNLELQMEVDERRRVQAVLEQWARYDQLTNLNNRRYFLSLAQYELDRAMRYQKPFSLLMMDIDLFKQVNDQYGHFIGDQVLMEFGSLLHANLREMDLLGRYGGDEFIILLPETLPEAALSLSERLRGCIAQHGFRTDAGILSVTSSIGIVGIQPEKDAQKPPLHVLINLADQAMYFAKRQGRNCCYLLPAL